MGRIPQELRENIARNIHELRQRKFPGRGGSKKCAEEFGVSPQQWSPWERGMRTPDEMRLNMLATFFNVTVEYIRRDNRPAQPDSEPSANLFVEVAGLPADNQHIAPDLALIPGAPSMPINDVIWNCHKVFRGYTDDGDQVLFECRLKLIRNKPRCQRS